MNLEETKAFVLSALSRFPANKEVTNAEIETAARKIMKAFRFLNKQDAAVAGEEQVRAKRANSTPSLRR